MAIDPGTALIGSSLIGAASSFLGGSPDTPAQNYGKKLDKQYEHQKRLMSNQLQWRVQDAEKAGLHPLFALGGGTPSGPTSVIPGQSIRRPSQAQQALSAIQSGLAQYANLKSQTKVNESLANLYDKQAAAMQAGAQGDDATAAAVATAAPEGPYKPPNVGRAIVEVTQPDGSKTRIANTEVGLENSEFLGAWYVFKDWAKTKGIRFRNIAAKDLTRLYHSTKGLKMDQIVDEMIDMIDKKHGAGVGR